MKRVVISCLILGAVCGLPVHAADVLSGLASPEVSIVAPDLRSAQKISDMEGNSNETLLAAYASLAAYESETDDLAERTLRGSGWSLQRIKTEHGRFIIGTYQDGTHTVGMIGIAGTERKSDVLLNLRSDLVALDNSDYGRVHEGYQKIAEEVFTAPLTQQMLAALPQRVIITGHSLGGAVAHLVGMKCANGGAVSRQQLRIITFASPDMGDKKLLDALAHYPSVNYVMNADVIPNLIHWLGKGYGTNPNDVQWDIHTPPIRFPHAMIRFLDEAWYQSALTFPTVLQSRKQSEIYVSSPEIEERISMSPELRRAYRSTAIRSINLPKGMSVYREYQQQTLSQACKQARAQGARELIWLPLAVYPDKENPLRTYGLQVSIVRYDLEKCEVRSWESHVLKQGKYTLFPLLHAYMHAFGNKIEERPRKDLSQ